MAGMSEDRQFSPDFHIGVSHYYGDIVRILFVVNAVLILAAQFLGVAFLTAPAALGAAVLLIVAAGLTNPVQAWIHWVNTLLSGIGLIISGNYVLTRYAAGNLLTDGWLVSIVALVFVSALYSSVKTLRGVLMRSAPLIK